MNRVERAARLAANELRARGRKWALVGGLAVSARAEPRTTRDVDIAVHVVDDADDRGRDLAALLDALVASHSGE